MKENLVSVIIPYYYKRNYLRKALQSVLLQSHKKLEIIIVYDNGSKNELDYVKKISILDPRIKLIINKKNIGAGRSRNKAIRISSGEYIAFLDADDYWKKSKITLQLQYMKLLGASITHTTYDVISGNNILGTRKARSFFNQKELLPSCDIGLSTVMLKRKILSKNYFFSNLNTKEDFLLWLTILNKYKIIGIKKNLSSWRKTDNSLSSSIVQKICDGFMVYYKYLDFSFYKSIYYLFLLSLNSLKR
jgi:teichuronic acid biosynthesis glycosyltransferase TuaG